jgi:hypothetical protein
MRERGSDLRCVRNICYLSLAYASGYEQHCQWRWRGDATIGDYRSIVLKAFWVIGVLIAAAYRGVGLWPQEPEQAPLMPLELTNDDFVSAVMMPDGLLTLTRRDGSFHELSTTQIQLFAWDSAAPVYVTAGPDKQPGVSGVDDEGNGVIDDRSELGATGSDDRMLTPEHADYGDAASGNVTSMILSRGAMRSVTDDRAIHGPSQILISATSPDQRLVSRIIDLIPALPNNE